MVVVGGAGKVMGSLLGAAALTVLPDFLSWISKLPILHPTIRHILTDYSYQLIAYGMLLLLFIFFMPRGLAGLLTDLGRWLRAGEIGPGWIPRTSLASPSVEVEVGNTLELVDTGLRASPHAPDGLLLKVEMVSNGQDALQVMGQRPFDVVLLDLLMPGMNGMTVLSTIKRRWPESEVIIFTGYPALETAKEAVSLGAYDYLAKPAGPDDVINAAHGAMNHKRWTLRSDPASSCAAMH